MANLDFFAARDDQTALVEFLLSQTDLHLFESCSLYGQNLAEFTSAREIDQRRNLGVDRYGNGCAVLLQLWSPSVMAEPIIERIALTPERCDGHTFWYCIRGGGLIQLYFGGVYGRILTKSHYGHYSQKGAERWGVDQGVNWKALAKISNKVQYHVRRRLAAARVLGRPVLPHAYQLTREGYQLKDSANSPWEYEIGQPMMTGRVGSP